MGKRAVCVYLAIVLMFTGILCRLYYLSLSGGALASVAQKQSAYLFEVDR